MQAKLHLLTPGLRTMKECNSLLLHIKLCNSRQRHCGIIYSLTFEQHLELGLIPGGRKGGPMGGRGGGVFKNVFQHS